MITKMKTEQQKVTVHSAWADRGNPTNHGAKHGESSGTPTSNSNGKMLAIGHSDTLQSMWNNTQLYLQMFPWLFLYGLGGISASSISDKGHKRHLLMYHDKHFQTNINFPFVAFSHEQMKCSTTQSFLLVDQSRFVDVSERFMNIDWSVMD